MSTRIQKLFIIITILQYSSIIAQSSHSIKKKLLSNKSNYKSEDHNYNESANYKIKDGTLLAWGYNVNGELGLDNRIYTPSVKKNSRLALKSDVKWISVSAKYHHRLGLKIDGTLWAWGRNQEGQLGTGDTIPNDMQTNGYESIYPVQIGQDKDWRRISAGNKHSLALKSNGTLWAWGENNKGQLGDGTIIRKTTPVQIGLDSNWISIEAGVNYSLGLKSDGTIWGWGENKYRELGDRTNSKRPVQIGTYNTWVSIATYGKSCFGLKSDGTVYGWGYNEFGQLNDGTKHNQSEPVKVKTGAKYLTILFHRFGHFFNDGNWFVGSDSHSPWFIPGRN